MKRISIAIVALFAFVTVVNAQKLAPKEVSLKFYRALKDKQYVEGFRWSVYRAAVEGLTASELKELEPEFARTFSSIPENIQVNGEQIAGDSAVVTLKFEGVEEPQQVGLVRVNGEWLVGDQETLGMVAAQGKGFFFNTRMIVSQNEAYEMLQRIIGAEIIYSRKFEGKYASMAELIRLGGVPKDLEDGTSVGYQFTLTISTDQKSFSTTATPIAHGKTGKISFYGDMNGIRGDDLNGKTATAAAPIYMPKQQ
jgi:hypothetical protein